MILSVLRSVGAIIASLIVALILVIAVEGFSAVFHPFPPGTDTSDFDVCAAHVAKYPQWALAVAAVGWGGTVFASTWVATRLGAGRHPAHGIAIGLLLLMAAAFNMYLLPYPLWFEVVTLLFFLLAILGAVKLGQAPRTLQSVFETAPDS